MSKSSLKRGAIGEDKVYKELLRYNGYQKIINNLIICGENGMSHQIDHIVIRENGIFVLETKNYFGAISGKEDDSYWFKSFNRKGKLITERIPNPLKQNKSHIRNIRKIIGANYHPAGLIVLVQNNADPLDIFCVSNIKDINDKISICDTEWLTYNDIDNLYNLLLKNEYDMNEEQHVKKVKNLKQKIVDNQKEMRVAIETRKCPRCKSELSVKGTQYSCPNCGYSFKL